MGRKGCYHKNTMCVPKYCKLEEQMLSPFSSIWAFFFGGGGGGGGFNLICDPEKLIKVPKTAVNMLNSIKVTYRLTVGRTGKDSSLYYYRLARLIM